MNSFIGFIKEQGVAGLAVGFILGGAVSNLVSAVIEDIINPLLGLILGRAEGLSSMAVGIGDAQLLVGHLITVIIDFLIIALVVFYGVKKLGLDKLDKK